MTEERWMACDDPLHMLRAFGGESTARKLSLFAVASCRRSGALMRREELRGVVDAVERCAEGGATYQEMVAAAKVAEWVGSTAAGRERTLADAAWCASTRGLWYTLWPSSQAERVARHLLSHDPEQSPHLATLVREVMGNPFRHVMFSAQWRSGSAIRLAERMYEEGDFGAMPILADALQDAGCDSEHILSHCRGEGPHVRGCWVVDLVLGKE
jgi:hypothetical protein